MKNFLNFFLPIGSVLLVGLVSILMCCCLPVTARQDSDFIYGRDAVKVVVKIVRVDACPGHPTKVIGEFYSFLASGERRIEIKDLNGFLPAVNDYYEVAKNNEGNYQLIHRMYYDKGGFSQVKNTEVNHNLR